jgi:hypothetical protein
MSQVHKEQLSAVDNALPNRSGLDVEIFGMEGVPDDVVQSHNQRVIAQFQQAEAERQAVTGNPPSGTGSGGQPAKRPKLGDVSDLKKRLAEHKAKRAEIAAGGSSGEATPVGAGQTQGPGGYVSFLVLIRGSILTLTCCDLVASLSSDCSRRDSTIYISSTLCRDRLSIPAGGEPRVSKFLTRRPSAVPHAAYTYWIHSTAISGWYCCAIYPALWDNATSFCDTTAPTSFPVTHSTSNGSGIPTTFW